MSNSFTNFIPEVWSLKLMKIFDRITVMKPLVNTDYEGEIKNAGDTVNVRLFGDVTTNTYTRDTAISFEDLGSTVEQLLINQQKYFAFKVDDMDRAQADVNIMEGYVQRAAISVRNVVDTRLLSHYADVPAANTIGSSTAPITLTKDNVYSYIVKLARKMDDANIDGDGRSLVVTTGLKEMLLQSPEFTRATGMGDNVVQNGRIGTVAGFNVHVTTNSPTVSSGKPVLAFTKDFISYASQISKVEHVRPYDFFADAVKGLYLYGSKVFSTHAYAGSLLWVTD